MFSDICALFFISWGGNFTGGGRIDVPRPEITTTASSFDFLPLLKLEKEWWSKDVKYDKIRGEVWWQWKTVISHAKRMQTWNSLLIKSIHREYLEDISKILLYTEFPICSIQVMDPFISTTKSDRQRTCELVCLMSPQGGQLMTASSAFNSWRQQSKWRIWKIL